METEPESPIKLKRPSMNGTKRTKSTDSAHDAIEEVVAVSAAEVESPPVYSPPAPKVRRKSSTSSLSKGKGQKTVKRDSSCGVPAESSSKSDSPGKGDSGGHQEVVSSSTEKDDDESMPTTDRQYSEAVELVCKDVSEEVVNL